MAIILAVVLLVMVLMDGVMFYVLRTAAVVTRKQVDACFLKELEGYGGFLDQKDQENQELKEEKEELKKEISDMEGVMVSLKTSPFYAPRPVPRDLFVPTARYIDNAFFDNHKLVKERMAGTDYREVMERIREKEPYNGNRALYEGACRILELLNLDTLYELVTMPGSVQADVLAETLVGTDRELLDGYLEELEEPASFDSLAFVTRMRELRTVHDPGMYVRTGEQEGAAFVRSEQDVVEQYDSNISEGVKFIHQNRLFDFSIYRLRSKV